MIPGSEPVRHVHAFEDETVIFKKGKITFYVGDEIIEAKAGDTIFMPHHYKIRSERVKALLIVTPGNFEAFLKAISTPYDKNVPPPIERELTVEEIEAFIALSNQHGVEFT